MNDQFKGLTDVDRVIHEPARLVIVTLLSAVAEADFLFLLRETGMSKGNLSSHLARLETAGYIEVEKTYRGKSPMTICRMTEGGKAAFDQYREAIKVSLFRPSIGGLQTA